VTGEDRVLFALAHCVASFYSERARDYRLGQGLPAEPGRVAVLVQLMAPADAAGVVFTADPVRGDRDRVLVNASLGLGESVVGGTVTPDLYVVDRRTLALTERHIARKARMTVAGPEGTREVPVPRRLADLPALTPCQARSAARLALEVERSAGAPVDIEVAFAGDRIFLLQSRPITTLPTRRLSP
jgi:phosphoenolpyruvate synthase/pyruvate phosphate dikinase